MLEQIHIFCLALDNDAFEMIKTNLTAGKRVGIQRKNFWSTGLL